MMCRNLIRSLVVLACVLVLSACDDKKSNRDEARASADQAEVQKYNAYVEAANMSQASYDDALANFQHYVQPVLDGKDKNDNLFFNSLTGIDAIRATLDKAHAMKPDMPELDGPAVALSDALSKVSPISSDMGNYISAKTYLSDKGAHGREIGPAYVSGLQALTVAQANFVKAIDAKDRARIKADFDAAQKDTVEYFRMGMIFHIKESMDFANAALDGKGLGDKEDAFKAALDQFNTMATRYEAKVREKNQTGCPSLMLYVNAYLATGRDIIQRTDNGTYEKERKRPPQFQLMQSQERQDATSLFQNYNNVISALNQGQC